ncbi:hypothetical protein LCGC14_1888320 [marine sediment metagenome]|uniref:Uncharacterized protein n=1 Tax=marine sediment metagenome TaxID=412755 RepID=A0A0F9G0F1_9ZZZZ
MTKEEKMEKKISQSLQNILDNPVIAVVPVIIVAVDQNAFEELKNNRLLKVTRELKFINSLASRVQLKNVLLLSESPFVQSIELDVDVEIKVKVNAEYLGKIAAESCYDVLEDKYKLGLWHGFIFCLGIGVLFIAGWEIWK